MTYAEQERLFKQIRQKFRTWSPTKASGYLAGILGEAKWPVPVPPMVADAATGEDYAAGYCYGFADARGIDALATDWAETLGITERAIDFCWWDR